MIIGGRLKLKSTKVENKPLLGKRPAKESRNDDD